MSPFVLYTLVSIGLFSICLYGLVVRAHLLRKLLALNMMGAAVFLFFIAVAYRFKDTPADPVPHAIVLTGIVVAVATTGFALALVRRLYAQSSIETLGDGDQAG